MTTVVVVACTLTQESMCQSIAKIVCSPQKVSVKNETDIWSVSAAVKTKILRRHYFVINAFLLCFLNLIL